MGEIPVRLVLHVRRFFCDNPACARHVFTERLPGVVASYARRTDRLRDVLHQIGYWLGGEAGARLAAKMTLGVSPSTLLRQTRKSAGASGGTPRVLGVRVLGVDDFAFLRGHRYGTLLVDLERRRPVDLLPDRKADTLSSWLRSHPGVAVISRDRAEAYADGAAKGAPEATQVADRWHLMRRIADSLQDVLGRERHALEEAARLLALDARKAAPTEPEEPALGTRERRKAERRARRLARYERLRELLAAWPPGRSQRELAKEAGISPATLYRWLKCDGFPERKPMPRRGRRIDPHVPYLAERWADGCRDATRLFREVAARGFTGTYAMVDYLLRAWWGKEPRKGRCRPAKARDKPRALSPREAAWLLLRDREKLKPGEQAFTEELCRRSPRVRKAGELSREFFRLVQQRSVPGLDAWLEAAEGCHLPEIERCCNGMRRDKAAIVAALEHPWSNGQTEGQINRLKSVKRQMYGRAKWDLLRARVLPPPLPCGA
jgi:transposase